MFTFAFLILSIIQGLTEFLPISSSGHLAVTKRFFDLQYGIELEVWLHLATLVSLSIFFRNDIRSMLHIKNKSKPNEPGRGWITLILVTSVITGAIGIIFKDMFESIYEKPALILLFLLVNGLILFALKFQKEQDEPIDYRKAAILGLVQSLAIFPGISRSGITIACLYFLGVRSENAFRFSFISSIPLILGAFLLKLKDHAFASFSQTDLLISFIVTCLTGLAALKILKTLTLSKKIHLFGYYCVIVSITGLLLMIDINL